MDAKLKELIQAHKLQELADEQKSKEPLPKRRKGNLLNPMSKVEECLRTWNLGYLFNFLEANNYDYDSRAMNAMANCSFKGTGEFPTYFHSSSVGEFLDNTPSWSCRKAQHKQNILSGPWNPAQLTLSIREGFRSIASDVKQISENGLNYVEEFKAQVRAMQLRSFRIVRFKSKYLCQLSLTRLSRIVSVSLLHVLRL